MARDGPRPGATSCYIRREGDAYCEAAIEPYVDWPSYRGSYTGNRHSPLDQINRDNIDGLSMQWFFPIPDMPMIEGTPVVIAGVMYVTAVNQVYALDAATGCEIWRYAQPRTAGLVGLDRTTAGSCWASRSSTRPGPKGSTTPGAPSSCRSQDDTQRGAAELHFGESGPYCTSQIRSSARWRSIVFVSRTRGREGARGCRRLAETGLDTRSEAFDSGTRPMLPTELERALKDPEREPPDLEGVLKLAIGNALPMGLR